MAVSTYPIAMKNIRQSIRVVLFAWLMVSACSRTALEVDIEGAPAVETVYCPAQFANCAENDPVVCETDLLASNDHCGTCGHACPHGLVCALGTCRNGKEMVEIESVAFASCVRRAEGTIACWGQNDTGQLGRGVVGDPLPVGDVLGIDDAAEVSAGGRHVCARLRSGQLSCWGDNQWAELGDGTRIGRSLPVQVSAIDDAIAHSAGVSSCAVRANGLLWCWGLNSHAKLNVGSAKDYQLTPSRVLDIDSIVAVGTGDPICAIDTKDQLWSWGINTYGTVGDGTYVNAPKPKVILTEIESVAIGPTQGCAIDRAHEVWCWGDLNGSRPVHHSGVHDAKKTTIGLDHACALTGSGEVVCWGSNPHGELGTSDYPPGEYVHVNGLSDVIDISAGSWHTCALESSGHVLCWGNNKFGQLGTEGIANSSSPIEVEIPLE